MGRGALADYGSSYVAGSSTIDRASENAAAIVKVKVVEGCMYTRVYAYTKCIQSVYLYAYTLRIHFVYAYTYSARINVYIPMCTGKHC